MFINCTNLNLFLSIRDIRNIDISVLRAKTVTEYRLNVKIVCKCSIRRKQKIYIWNTKNENAVSPSFAPASL